MTDLKDMPPLVPELYVRDLDKSLDFYVSLLGFDVAYARPENRFAMIRRQGSYLMLDEIVKEDARTGSSWITAPLEAPFGRGINFEIVTTDIDALIKKIKAANLSFFLPPEEAWYRAGDSDLGSKQFIVLDPDGYALRFAQSLGQRPTQQEIKK